MRIVASLQSGPVEGKRGGREDGKSSIALSQSGQ